MSIINKLWQYRWVLRNLPQTIWFNFHHLPFRQAVKLPIFLYKPHLLNCSGKVSIQYGGGKITPGMIQLGRYMVSIYPNTGITWENRGTIVFRGHCALGNNSFVSVGKSGNVSFGHHFGASTSIKLVSYCGITFGNQVQCGWDCLFMDTNFHQMIYLDDSKGPKAYGQIKIGDSCWIGTKSVVQKNTILPNKTTVASCSLVNKPYDIPEASIIAGQPAKLVKTGIWRDIHNDIIEYQRN